ncbi:hypothetical protein [Marinobacterium maritimum]
MDIDDPKLAELMKSASASTASEAPSPTPSAISGTAPRFEFDFPAISDFAFSTDFKEPSHGDWKFDFGELSLNGIVNKEAKRRRIDSLNVPILAIDTEYVLHENGLNNIILCYSYAIGFDDNYTTGIIETQSKGRDGRISLAKLLITAIEDALENETLDAWPEAIILGAHFLRADLFTLSDAFTDIKANVQGVRKSVASLGDAYGVDIDEIKDRIIRREQFTKYDKSSKKRTVDVLFYDSMLLAPAGKSLADVGALVGLPKIEIEPPYRIEEMDVFQREQPEKFKAYAINDAEISYRHLLKMIYFVVEELGLNGLPYTVGGMATRKFLNTIGDDYRKAFGIRQLSKVVWPKDGGKPKTVKGDIPEPARAILEQFAIDCYHGGRNECFMTGPTEVGQWNDYDAPSCYTVILNACRPLDYEAFYMCSDPAAFTVDVCGLARVRFGFPPDTRFPCLPVTTEEYGLYYPLEGESYCTAPEIAVAMSMGCDIQILQGFIVPWVEGAESVFTEFMQFVRHKRNQHVKGSFEERLSKELGNSLYGKLAQGLSGKTAFDVAQGISSRIQPSPITNPYFAAHVTGFARALMSEMLNGIDSDKQVVSVTTDGFLTNADLDKGEIKLDGPVCQQFRRLYHLIDPDGGEILELKHRAKQLIAMKTRGQITAEEEYGFEPVIAKAGVQVPKHVENQHRHMLDLYLDRYPDQTVPYTTLTSSRQQFMFNRDMVNQTKDVRLNLEPDFKRQLVNPKMVLVDGKQHIAFDSKPHPCREDGEFCRRRLDLWRKNNCLKTMEDWESLEEDILLAKLTDQLPIRPQTGEPVDQFFRRMFLRVYAQELYNVPRTYTYKRMAEWLTAKGYPTNPGQFGYASTAPLAEGMIPVTASTIRLLHLLLGEFPEFDYEPLFVADQRCEIAGWLERLRSS